VSGPTATAPVVVWDLGNVLIRWDRRNLYRKLFDDPAEMDHFLDTVATLEWNYQLDLGAPLAASVELLAAQYPQYAYHLRAYDLRWTEMLDGEIAASVALLREVHANDVPCFALTNFSRELIDRTVPMFDWFSCFDGMVVSADIALGKPDPAIYRYLLDAYDLQPEQCLFADDNLANVEAAREIGMRAHHFAESASVDWATAIRSHGAL
jgi:2-haloacid dehalogenase